MKSIFIRSLLWSAAAFAIPVACSLYVVFASDLSYDPALDNDGDVQGAGLFLLASPVFFAALVLLVFVISLAVHRLRRVS